MASAHSGKDVPPRPMSPPNAPGSPVAPVAAVDPPMAGSGGSSKPSRRVWVILTMYRPNVTNEATLRQQLGREVAVHAQISLGPTWRDVSLNVQLKAYENSYLRLALRGTYGASVHKGGSLPKYPVRDEFRYYELTGGTTLTNEELLDPTNGKGIASEVWGQNPWVSLGDRGATPYNGPMSFVEKLLRHPAFRGPAWKGEPMLEADFAVGKRYWTEFNHPWTALVDTIHCALPERLNTFRLRHNLPPEWIKPKPPVVRTGLGQENPSNGGAPNRGRQLTPNDDDSVWGAVSATDDEGDNTSAWEGPQQPHNDDHDEARERMALSPADWSSDSGDSALPWSEWSDSSTDADWSDSSSDTS